MATQCSPALALAAQADFIVSVDLDLLVLKTFKKIPLIESVEGATHASVLDRHGSTQDHDSAHGTELQCRYR
jgi:hypothetical protein